MNDQRLVQLEPLAAALMNVEHMLNTALEEIKAWQLSPDGLPSASALQEHRDNLLMTYARYRILQDEYAALINLNARLMAQHESAKEAFQAGWQARLTDIEARASSEEYALLHNLLHQINVDDSLI